MTPYGLKDMCMSLLKPSNYDVFHRYFVHSSTNNTFTISWEIVLPKTALSGDIKLYLDSLIRLPESCGSSPLKRYKMVAKNMEGLPKMLARLPDFGFR